jgi:hypothetical protein
MVSTNGLPDAILVSEDLYLLGSMTYLKCESDVTHNSLPVTHFTASQVLVTTWNHLCLFFLTKGYNG